MHPYNTRLAKRAEGNASYANACADYCHTIILHDLGIQRAVNRASLRAAASMVALDFEKVKRRRRGLVAALG